MFEYVRKVFFIGELTVDIQLSGAQLLIWDRECDCMCCTNNSC